MAINPLAPVTEYQSTLNRIFWFTSASAIASVWLLRHYIPGVQAALSQVDIEMQAGAGKLLPIAGGYLIPALAVGLVSRIFRIHSLLGNWLGIRERFEIDVILKGIAQRVGIDAESVAEETWLAERHELMRQVFYRYTNSREPVIDGPLVQQALDMWSWFWIVLEAAAVFVLTGLILIAAGAHEAGLTTFGGSLAVAAFGLPAIRSQCKVYAMAQVRSILTDPIREVEVRRVLASLAKPTTPWRRAA